MPSRWLRSGISPPVDDVMSRCLSQSNCFHLTFTLHISCSLGLLLALFPMVPFGGPLGIRVHWLISVAEVQLGKVTSHSVSLISNVRCLPVQCVRVYVCINVFFRFQVVSSADFCIIGSKHTAPEY